MSILLFTDSTYGDVTCAEEHRDHPSGEVTAGRYTAWLSPETAAAGHAYVVEGYDSKEWHMCELGAAGCTGHHHVLCVPGKAYNIYNIIGMTFSTYICMHL